MKYDKFEKHFSSGRLAKYALASKNKKNKTMLLYKANMAVSQAFIPLICVLEVTLRNNLNAVLSAHFSDNDWIVNQKDGFMNHPTLQNIDKKTGKARDNRYHLKEVQKSISKAKREQRPITSDYLISEQTFGFWSSLYNTHHYRILKGVPIQIFHNMPPGHGRKEAESILSQIRDFRNRISHHEPICFDSSNQKNFSEAKSVHSLIIKIIKWIDPSIVSFIKEIDYVETSIIRMERKYNKI